MIIAIDGHSSCGKSTIAKAIAKKYNFIFVDTGAMYRTVTLFCLQNNLIENGIVNEASLEEKIDSIEITFKINDSNKLQETYLNNENVEKQIRGLGVSNNVSPVSKLKFVRQKLVALQREYGKKGSVVMDGRDIGTVVFPNADLKFFVTASAEVRAQRRYNELISKGESVDYTAILENVKSRDFQDSTRKESPLKQADDAILLDNSNMTKEGQLEWIYNKIDQLLK